MTPLEYKAIRDSGAAHFLLDVREPSEFAIANLGGTLIPLAELPRRLEELPKERDIIVLCHHGIRSAQAVGYLKQQGFGRARNLSGGLDRWSLEVDPTVPRY